MLRFLLFVAAVAGLWWFVFRFNKVSGPQQKQMLTKFILYALAGFILLLVITGRAHWLFAIIGAAIPWLQRLIVLKRAWNTFKRPVEQSTSTPGQSKVSSEYLQMRLDHETGEMDGTILKGEHQGSKLSDLNLEQLQALWRYCSVDADSRNLLSAYLEYRFPDEWQEGLSSSQHEHTDTPGTAMTREEAFAILGLEENATDQDVINAHKKLMQKLHPDRGGSEYLAMKINQAKSVLLK